MKTFAYIFSLVCLSSHAQHQTGLVFDAQSGIPKKKYTIQLGGFGVSGFTQAETMIYRTKNGYVALYDGNDSKVMGRPFVTHIEFDTSKTGCIIDGKEFKGKVYRSELLPSKIENVPNSVFSKAPLPVEFPAGACPTNKIAVNILGPTCLSPDPACRRLKVYQSYEVSPGDLHFLDALEDEKELKKLPGLRGAEE
jgi:hypothetical protein